MAILAPALEQQVINMIKAQLYDFALNLQLLLTNNTGEFAVDFYEFVSEHAPTNCTIDKKFEPILDQVPLLVLGMINNSTDMITASIETILVEMTKLDTNDAELAGYVDAFLLTNFDIVVAPIDPYRVLITHFPLAAHQLSCGTDGEDLTMYRQFWEAMSKTNFSDYESVQEFVQAIFPGMIMPMPEFDLEMFLNYQENMTCNITAEEMMQLQMYMNMTKEDMEKEEKMKSMWYLPKWWGYSKMSHDHDKMDDHNMANDKEHSIMDMMYDEEEMKMMMLVNKYKSCMYIKENKENILAFAGLVKSTNFSNPISILFFVKTMLTYSDECATEAQIDAVVNVIGGYLFNVSEVEQDQLWSNLFEAHISETGYKFIAQFENVWATLVGKQESISRVEYMIIAHYYYDYGCRNETVNLDMFMEKVTAVLTKVNFTMLNHSAIMQEIHAQFPLPDNFTKMYEVYHALSEVLPKLKAFDEYYNANYTALFYDILLYYDHKHNTSYAQGNIDFNMVYTKFCNSSMEDMKEEEAMMMSMMKMNDENEEDMEHMIFCSHLENYKEEDLNKLFANFTMYFQNTNFSDPVEVLQLIGKLEIFEKQNYTKEEIDLSIQVMSSILMGEDNSMFKGVLSFMAYKWSKMMDMDYMMGMCMEEKEGDEMNMSHKMKSMMCEQMMNSNMSMEMDWEEMQAKIQYIIKSVVSTNFSDEASTINFYNQLIDMMTEKHMINNATVQSIKAVVQAVVMNASDAVIADLWHEMLNLTLSDTGYEFIEKLDHVLQMNNMTADIYIFVPSVTLLYWYQTAMKNETDMLDAKLANLTVILDEILSGANLTQIFEKIAMTFPMGNISDHVDKFLTMFNMTGNMTMSCGLTDQGLYLEMMFPDFMQILEKVACPFIDGENLTKSMFVEILNNITLLITSTDYTMADEVSTMIQYFSDLFESNAEPGEVFALAKVITGYVNGEDMEQVNGYWIEFYSYGLTPEYLAMMSEIERILIEANVSTPNTSLVQAYQSMYSQTFYFNSLMSDMGGNDMYPQDEMLQMYINTTMMINAQYAKIANILKVVHPQNVDFAVIREATSNEYPELTDFQLDVMFSYTPEIIQGFITNDTNLVMENVISMLNAFLPNNTIANEMSNVIVELMGVYNTTLDPVAVYAIYLVPRIPFAFNDDNITMAFEQLYANSTANMKLQIEVAKLIQGKPSDLTTAMENYFIVMYMEVPQFIKPLVTIATPLSEIDYESATAMDEVYAILINMLDEYLTLYPDEKAFVAAKLQFEVQWAIQVNMKFTEVEAEKLYEIMVIQKQMNNILAEMEAEFLNEYFPVLGAINAFYTSLPSDKQKSLYVTTVMIFANMASNQTSLDEGINQLLNLILDNIDLQAEIGNVINPL